MLFDRQMQTKDGKHLCPRQTFYGYLSYTGVDIILCTPRISSEGKNCYWCIPLHVFWSMESYSKARPWWISSSLKFSTNSLIAEKHITLRLIYANIRDEIVILWLATINRYIANFKYLNSSCIFAFIIYSYNFIIARCSYPQIAHFMANIAKYDVH